MPPSFPPRRSSDLLQGLLPALPASSSRSNTPLAGGPDMKTVVIGGSGLIGTKLVSRLREKDHEVVAASPASGVNTITGEGLAEALMDTKVVVDVANSPSFEEDRKSVV